MYTLLPWTVWCDVQSELEWALKVAYLHPSCRKQRAMVGKTEVMSYNSNSAVWSRKLQSQHGPIFRAGLATVHYVCKQTNKNVLV